MDQGNRMKGFPLFQVWGVPFQAIRNELRKTRDFSAFLSMVCAFSGNIEWIKDGERFSAF